MKNFLLIAITAVLLQALIGCQKEELLYSCDKETNEWVKNNLAEIQQMNRSDMLPLSGEQQRGCFRAFTPEQRYGVWIDKLIQVRNIGLNSKELKHIDLLLATMKVDWFDEQTREDADRFAEIDQFLKEWVDNAYNLLGWSRDEVGSIVASLYEVERKDNTIVLRVIDVITMADHGGGGGSGGYTFDCNCYIYDDWCFNNKKCKNDVGCNKSNWGCGSFWSNGCNGLCGATVIVKPA